MVLISKVADYLCCRYCTLGPECHKLKL